MGAYWASDPRLQNQGDIITPVLGDVCEDGTYLYDPCPYGQYCKDTWFGSRCTCVEGLERYADLCGHPCTESAFFSPACPERSCCSLTSFGWTCLENIDSYANGCQDWRIVVLSFLLYINFESSYWLNTQIQNQSHTASLCHKSVWWIVVSIDMKNVIANLNFSVSNES